VSTSSSRKYPELVPTTYRESELKSERPEPPERPESQYLSGDVIADRYRLVRKIGQGGMGVVWVAHSLVLGVDIALKLIRADPSDSGVASRMAREAHAAARIGHPALVRVFDFGWTTRGDPFLVMELVHGEALSTLLRRESRVGAIRAAQIILPLADGIRCAHEKGIVHRDIKPENVFLATDSFGRLQPKLLDFGIAKLDVRSSGARITQLGAVLGSPEFMSPEQARGQQDIDERTDIWSMCVMLYEMITGAMPFQDRNYNALMQLIMNEEPVPTTELSAGDAGLWKLISRGLKKKREDRWSTMTELGEALALWLYEHGVKEDASGQSIRALWLDSALSGVRVEVVTGNRNRSEPPAERSEPPLPLGSRSFGRRLVWQAKRARRYVKRRVVPISLLGMGILLGTIVTFLSTGGAEAPQRLDPKLGSVMTPVATSVATALQNSQAQPSSPSAPAADPMPATSVSSSGRRATPQAVRPKKKSIHDFGF
jgi:eukaryotic-like serine/threonine-protein kinase